MACSLDSLRVKRTMATITNTVAERRQEQRVLSSSRTKIVERRAFAEGGREEGEFWTARQRQGHALHEISYRACFKPQLPKFFIERYSRPADRVLDPFSGRGTTALQAALMGRKVAASDGNPLCLMLLRPRLLPPSLEAIEERLRTIEQGGACCRASRDSEIDSETLERDLLVFFHPKVLERLVALKAWFCEREESGAFDGVDGWIRMVALNRLTGHSSGFFSVRTMPPNQAVSLQTQRRLNAKHGQKPLWRDVAALILKKSKSLLRDGVPSLQARNMKLAVCPSQKLSYLKKNSVDLVVTSPPFLNTVDYKKDNWLRLWFADLKTEAMACDVHASLERWRSFVRDTFVEFARVVRSGGHVAFEVGEVRGGSVLLEEEVMDAVAGLPFMHAKTFINQQSFTKTANCWGVKNNERGTNSNRIAVFERC